MDSVRKTLVERLVGKGLHVSTIPAYIRNLGNIVASEPNISPQELSVRMEFLGWEEFELDERTLELVLACLDLDLPAQSIGGSAKYFHSILTGSWNAAALSSDFPSINGGVVAVQNEIDDRGKVHTRTL